MIKCLNILEICLKKHVWNKGPVKPLFENCLHCILCSDQFRWIYTINYYFVCEITVIYTGNHLTFTRFSSAWVQLYLHRSIIIKSACTCKYMSRLYKIDIDRSPSNFRTIVLAIAFFFLSNWWKISYLNQTFVKL